MALPVNSTAPKFGTQATVITTTGTIADDAYSAQGDAAAWVNSDDADSATIHLNAATAAGVTAGAFLEVHGRKINIDGTSDQPAVDANWNGGFLKSIRLATGATTHVDEKVVSLPVGATGQSWEFYLKLKGSGTTLSTGAVVKITPRAFGPR